MNIEHQIESSNVLVKSRRDVLCCLCYLFYHYNGLNAVEELFECKHLLSYTYVITDCRLLTMVAVTFS